MAVPDFGDCEEDLYMAYQGRIGELTGFQLRNGRIIGVLDYHRDMGDLPAYQLRFSDGTVGLVPSGDCVQTTRAAYNEQSPPPES